MVTSHPPMSPIPTLALEGIGANVISECPLDGNGLENYPRPRSSSPPDTGDQKLAMIVSKAEGLSCDRSTPLFQGV